MIDSGPAAINIPKYVEFEPKIDITMDYLLKKLRSSFDKQDIMKKMTKIVLSIMGYLVIQFVFRKKINR